MNIFFTKSVLACPEHCDAHIYISYIPCNPNVTSAASAVPDEAFLQLRQKIQEVTRKIPPNLREKLLPQHYREYLTAVAKQYGIGSLSSLKDEYIERRQRRRATGRVPAPMIKPEANPSTNAVASKVCLCYTRIILVRAFVFCMF